MHRDLAQMKQHGFNGLEFPTPGVTLDSSGNVTKLDTSAMERFVSIAVDEGFGGQWMGQTITTGIISTINNAGYASTSTQFGTAYTQALQKLVDWMNTPVGAKLAIWILDEPRESDASRNYVTTMQYVGLAKTVPGAKLTITVMDDMDSKIDYSQFANVLDIMQTHPSPNSAQLMTKTYAQGKPDWFYNTGGDLRLVYGFFQYKYGLRNGAWEWFYDWLDGQLFDNWPYTPFNNHWRYTYPGPTGPSRR